MEEEKAKNLEYYYDHREEILAKRREKYWEDLEESRRKVRERVARHRQRAKKIQHSTDN